MEKAIAMLLQRNSFSCGPIALMNAELIRGKRISYRKHYTVYRDLLNCNFLTGTSWKQFDRLCGVLGYRMTYSRSGPILAQQKLADGHYHYCVLTDCQKYGAYIINSANFKHEYISGDHFWGSIIRAWQI